ncbi:MAG: hypothetical protein KF730_01970 [Sphingomonas sp.]|uniref:hypothetical protein n=1 Tax=Sphingomonas sp. TaxID=28214 RepID=UPI0025F559EA|nr:hypothetical protein [Sphingomonas sp.]MBX3563320.1 hypothetical protein [Sphingomonas sp.]
MKPLACVAAVLIAGCASAPAEAQSLSSCSVGQRVKSPAGPATVVSVQGSSCTVRVDGRSYNDVYAAFMLEALGGPPRTAAQPRAAAPVAAAPGGNPKPGVYQCVGGPAGNLKLRFFTGGGYANEQGARGRYAPGKNGQIKFVTGPWEGYYGKVLANGRIGLTSVEGGSFYNMTCDPR